MATENIKNHKKNIYIKTKPLKENDTFGWKHYQSNKLKYYVKQTHKNKKKHLYYVKKELNSSVLVC